MHGHGALVGADGSRYEGLLIKGEIAGQVFFLFIFLFLGADGSCYEGLLIKGDIAGQVYFFLFSFFFVWRASGR